VPGLQPSTGPPARSARSARKSEKDEEILPAHFALLAARREAEDLARRVCVRGGIEVAGKKFMDVCLAIEQAHLFNSKALIYLNALRRLGNLAAHPETGVEFSVKDRDVVSQLLRDLIDETQREAP